MGEEPCCPNCGIPLKVIIAISQVVEELVEVRREWRRASRDAALAIERLRHAEAELSETRKELGIRTRELKACREARKALEDAAIKQTP